jgi:hypothetical protein
VLWQPLLMPIQRGTMLAESLAQISRANKAEQALKKAAASAIIEKCGPAAAVKLQKQRMDVLKLTMLEIRALSLHYFNTEIPKEIKKWWCLHSLC